MYEMLIITVIAGVPDLHGLPVPVLQHPGEHEQLRRAVWLRVHLDRGAMQAWGLAGMYSVQVYAA